MSKPLKYPVRRHFNHDKQTDDLLVKKAGKIGMTPSEYLRALAKASLIDLPIINESDPAGHKLLKRWSRLFSRRTKKHPGLQNWNVINSLADDTDNFLNGTIEEVKGGTE